MKKKWHYLTQIINPDGYRNYTRVQQIVTHHNDALRNQRNDPNIGPIYQRTDPLVTTYNAMMRNKMLSKSVSSGQVQSYKTLKRQLPLALAKWDGRIQQVFPIDTMEHKKLFVVGRSEIYTGSAVAVITKLETFSDLVKKHVELNDIAASIDAYIFEMKVARNTKGELSNDIDAKAMALNEAYIAVVSMIYRNLGRFIDIYCDDFDRIEQFYDLTLIRRRTSENKLKGLVIEIPRLSRQLWMPAFTSGDILSIINKTKKSVYYFLAERPDETEPENVTELYPNEVTDLKGSILLSANKKYVVFVNKHNSWNVTVEVKVEKQ